jgi:hypothetical protein
MSMTPETRRELEAYLAEKSAKGHVEATFAYDDQKASVTIAGRSVAGGSLRDSSRNVLFRGPEDVAAVKSAIDYVVGTLST